MSDGIFLLRDGNLIEMLAQPYDSEHLLQSLLADYPSLIAGHQIDSLAPRRWLLVSREMGVPAEDDGGSRWFLDHLFLDQDGIPTLVEVKRGTDTRIRREVVGQMLDYAANAVVYWPVEEIQKRFTARCVATDTDPDSELIHLLGVGQETEVFWASVKRNLQSGRIRLIFIADIIPPELRRVVEFLNEQMDPAEVLALEIKQYVGQGLQTLVPRIIGQTAEAQQKKSASKEAGRDWDEASFFETITAKMGAEIASVARSIFNWARTQGDVWFGSGKRDGSFGLKIAVERESRYIFALYTYGSIEISFQWLKNGPPFDDAGKRLELLERLNAIEGVSHPSDAIERRPSIPLGLLAKPESLERFLDALEWVVKESRKALATR